MKKVIISLALMLACFTTSLFAMEWGGLIDNVTGVSTTDFKKMTINQTNDLFLWANCDVTKDGALRFSTEGMYKFSFNTMDRNNEFKGMKHVLDLNILKLTGKWTVKKNNIFLDAGRFNYADRAGAYFIQKSDGINLRFTSKKFNLGAYVGYTGLQNNMNVYMTEDVLSGATGTQLYKLAYGYVPLMFDVTFNRVGKASIGLQASYFIDTTKNKKNKAFGTFSLKAPLSNKGSFSTNIVVGSQNFKNIMLFGAADFSFFIKGSVIIGVGGEYASGNNKIFASYSPVSYRPVSSRVADVDVIVPRVTGMLVLGDAVVSLSEKLTMSLPDGNFELNGLDSNLGFVYNVFSDLQIGCNAAVYTDFKSSENNNYSINVNAALAF